MARTFLSAPLKDEVDRSAMCTLREIVKTCVVLACRKYDGDWHEEIACFTLRNLNEANFHLLRASSFGRWKPPPDYLITSRQCDRPRLAWISAQIANAIPYGPLIAGAWLRLLETLDHALLTPDESRRLFRPFKMRLWIVLVDRLLVRLGVSKRNYPRDERLFTCACKETWYLDEIIPGSLRRLRLKRSLTSISSFLRSRHLRENHLRCCPTTKLLCLLKKNDFCFSIHACS